MKYKSAVLGCGPRAAAHIEAYKDLDEITLTAACDLDDARRNDYAKRFSIPNMYSDLETMLATERPDVLHIVTPPTIREQPLALAIKHGVKGIIVEKPIALTLDQLAGIEKLAADSGIKIAVNMQRRYFPTCRDLKKVLDRKLIGNIRFIRCVAKGNILSMGPHMVDLLLYLLNDVEPATVWAVAEGMNGYDYAHPAPARMLFRLVLPGGITVYGEDADDAVGIVGETDFWQHHEFDIWGSTGRAWWAQNINWGYQAAGMAEPVINDSKWLVGDLDGQREFTRAMAHWLDGRAVHDNCLAHTVSGFQVIMAMMQSAYDGAIVKYPATVDRDIKEKLQKRLEGKAGASKRQADG